MEFPDGHSILVLAEGRLVNLGCATGHPSFVMSAPSPTRCWRRSSSSTNASLYENKVYTLPKHLDERVARLHLGQLGVKLTEMLQGPGRLPRRPAGRALQARHLPVLICVR